MSQPHDLEEDEGLLYRLFVVLRGSLPVVREDLSSRVGRRVSLLQDDPRLKQPPVDGILAGFIKELLGLLDDTIQRKTPKK